MSDIELGDDESITLVCTDLRTRNPTSAEAVGVRGSLELHDKVWLTVPDYYKKSFVAYGPPIAVHDSVLEGAAILASGSGMITGPTPIEPIKVETGAVTLPPVRISSPPLSVIERLRAQEAGDRVDLSEQLALLRAAVMELYDAKK